MFFLLRCSISIQGGQTIKKIDAGGFIVGFTENCINTCLSQCDDARFFRDIIPRNYDATHFFLNSDIYHFGKNWTVSFTYLQKYTNIIKFYKI